MPESFSAELPKAKRGQVKFCWTASDAAASLNLTLFPITMRNIRLSETVRTILHSHGWEEGRQVDIGEILVFLKSKSIDPIAADFLQEFHGLHLQLPNGWISAVQFDVFEEMTFLEEGELARLESLMGQPLCPVGLGGRFLLFIAPSGEMTFLHDEWLLYLRAKNVFDTFEVICTPEFKDYDTIMLKQEQKPSAFRDRE